MLPVCFSPVFQTSFPGTDVDYDMSYELIELGNNSMKSDEGRRMILVERPRVPLCFCSPASQRFMLVTEFSAFCARPSQQFHVDYGTLWVSARSCENNKELHVLSCVPFTQLWRDNNGEKFMAVTRGYQPPLSRDAAVSPHLFVIAPLVLSPLLNVPSSRPPPPLMMTIFLDFQSNVWSISLFLCSNSDHHSQKQQACWATSCSLPLLIITRFKLSPSFSSSSFIFFFPLPPRLKLPGGPFHHATISFYSCLFHLH